MPEMREDGAGIETTRLGRVLRPKPEAATLYELISRRTNERTTARRRRPTRKPPTAIASPQMQE